MWDEVCEQQKDKKNSEQNSKNKTCEFLMCCVLGHKCSLSTLRKKKEKASLHTTSINLAQLEQPPRVAYISNEPYFVYL